MTLRPVPTAWLLQLLVIFASGCGGSGGGAGDPACTPGTASTSGQFVTFCGAVEPEVTFDGLYGYKFLSVDGAMSDGSGDRYTPTVGLDPATNRLSFQGRDVGSVKLVRVAGQVRAGLVADSGKYLSFVRSGIAGQLSDVTVSTITATLATPGGGTSAYSGPYATYVSYLLGRVSGWNATTPPATHEQVCMRDAYVDAALTYAWAASAYASQGSSYQATESATQAYQNLQSANDLCSGVPPPAGSTPCSTLGVWGCPPPF